MSYGGIPTGRQELESRIVRRAWSDPGFRALLLSDPREALSLELGVEVPEELRVQVVEERSDFLCIVLPVDLSEMGMDARWAMTGLRPRPAPPQ